MSTSFLEILTQLHWLWSRGCRYDPEKDGHDSYLLAIHEMRKRGIIDGRFEPRNDEERQWLKEEAS